MSLVKFILILIYLTKFTNQNEFPYLTDHQTRFINEMKSNELKSNEIFMEFHEHENRNYQFYKQQQELLIEHCNFELTNQTGILHSPMFPEKLQTNRSLTCIWRIHNPSSNELSAVELNIQVVNLRKWSSNQGNCSDTLIITYETKSNDTEQSPQFKRIVLNSKTRTYPKKIISPRGELLVNLTICATMQSCPVFQAPINTTSNLTNKSQHNQPTTLMAIVAGKPTFFEPKYELITQPITGFYANYRLVNCSGCGIGDSDCSDTHQCDSLCGCVLFFNKS